MNKIPCFSEQALTSISKIIGDTSLGLTGTEITRYLQKSKIPDISLDTTKWKRLYNAFADFQNKRQFGNHVILFINNVMDPILYTDCPDVFTSWQDKLNAVLSFAGFYIRDDGKVCHSDKADNLNDALNRTNRIHAALVMRKVHKDVLDCCKKELFQENYFHAVFEATKSIATKIRNMSGLTCDGAELAQKVFGLGKDSKPILAINNLKTETEIGEQKGFVSLLVGVFGVIRNPLAHEPKKEWDMSEQDTLDILTTISLIHRKLDESYRFN